MIYYTHLAFGLFVSLYYLTLFDVNYGLFFVLITLFFSILPDIDESKSKIGRKNKTISKIIGFVFGHRGIFHSIYIPLILIFIFYNNINNEIGIAIFLGYFSHLVADGLTKQGVRPFYPLINMKINGFFKTNSLVEKVFFSVLVLWDIALLFNYI